MVRAVPDGHPALQGVVSDLAGKMKLIKIDGDDSPKLAECFSVTTAPALPA
jgi:thioredoxin-like negative regulator of GroEL